MKFVREMWGIMPSLHRQATILGALIAIMCWVGVAIIQLPWH